MLKVVGVGVAGQFADDADQQDVVSVAVVEAANLVLPAAVDLLGHPVGCLVFRQILVAF